MTFTIKTIGCKVNTYESNKIKAELINAGLIFIDAKEKEEYKDLDFYVINTCSVTSVADKKSRQMIHSVKALNPDVKVVATGCYVDSHIDDLDKDIDIYFKNADKMTLAEKLIDICKKEGKVDSKENYTSDTRIREFIKIQDGCNQYCTYCIIPFLRGNIKSRDDADIIAEIKEKVKNGTKEIVLTGIHLSSFGLDRVDKTYESEGSISIARESLLKIIEEIANISELSRIRLGSLEPRIIDEEFIKKVNAGTVGEKFCPSFCLSLQSGCDKVLKAMNRHYSTKDFENACDIIRKYMKNATITTDIIVGFPGETKEDFEESLSFVKKMRFYNTNIFPFSRRKGTKADLMDNQLTKEEKHERVLKMISACDKITKEIESEYNKETHDILVEEVIEENGKKYEIGYTKEYIKKKMPI